MYTECATKIAWGKLGDLYKYFNSRYENAKKEHAIPDKITQGYCYTVGNHTLKYNYLLTRHIFNYIQFINNKFNFKVLTIDEPWQEINFVNMHPSSSFEFGNTIPAGTWQLISDPNI